ncbi:MAG: hypothetical protein ACI8QW_000298 [Saprospiraceae bacterium]|jgi:hypothetical protein
MKNSKVLKGFLIISGLLLIFVGGSILFNPVGFTAKNGIDLGGNISLLNDVRSSGSLFLLIGVFILLGSFIQKLIYTSSFLVIIGYLGVGFGRVVSILSDGMPADGLIKAYKR